MGINISGLGIANAIGFKPRVDGGRRFLPPNIQSSLVSVISTYGKKNTDSDRSILKDLTGKGNDFKLFNFSFSEASGYGEYKTDFNKNWALEMSVITGNQIVTFNRGDYKSGIFFLKIPTFLKVNVSSFTVDVDFKSSKEDAAPYYYYWDTTGKRNQIRLVKGKNVLPVNYASNSVEGTSGSGFHDSFCDTVTIKQIPDFEGWLCTDGVNDIIESVKPISEMLEGSNEITVVSIIHQISQIPGSEVNKGLNNQICYYDSPTTRGYLRNSVKDVGKTGIYGYTFNGTAHSVINNILGDKNDYIAVRNNEGIALNGVFSVCGYKNYFGELKELSSIAYAGGFIANKVLTTDEINQVIAYYNLDRPGEIIKPSILYDIRKQGLTNENHAEFNDKLIDYSGNGRDLQLFNIGWKGESGIGRYTEEFKNNYWFIQFSQTGVIKDGNSIKVVGKLSNAYLLYHIREVSTNAFKVKITGIKDKIRYSYILSGKENNVYFSVDGIYDIPASESIEKNKTSCGFYINNASVALDWIGLTIEIIPSNKGALCLDGINDFGKVINMPIYKDYTFIVDREILSIDNIGIIASKSESAEDETKHGAFIFEYLTAPNIINTWSYYKNNINIANTDFIRGISYQSKYNYNGKDLIIGTSKDSDKLYLGTIRDNSDKYGNIAIYFLMSFPYSMNKFLIERQLKKYKAGTLYKDMVEFRPVIKSNIDIKNIVYLDKDSNVVKVGDYISIGSNIKTSITVLDGYKISKVSSTAFNNITIEKSNTDFIYDVIFYGIKKSPQKINLVIEQDSDYVQWNPNIKANVSKYSVTANIRKTDGTTLKLVNGQFYSTSITGNLVLDIVPPYKDSDEVTNVVIDGKSYTPTKDSSGNYYRLEIPLVFPKEINITIQEYVRYEDIVQPYPVLLRFKDENNNEISWGDKIKLGSSIIRIGSFNDCNLLKDIYTVSNAKLNGSPLPSTPHVVERQMVFTCTATWIFDDNEPNCILSPRLLHAPNSSYKILGHIPDISGHGNHGVIYNSAYKLNSGANGYLVDFTTLRDYGTKGIVRTDSKIYLDESFDYDNGFWLGYTNSPSPTYKVRVSGIPKDGVLSYTGGSWINLINGINELPARTNTKEIYGFFAQTPNVDWSNLVIEQIGEYEGAYCLDGIDDFITIPTLSKGGKQVLMKVNWSTLNGFIYDQRPASGDKIFGIYTQGDVIAYSQNNNGNTYIDGIINNNIIGSNLSKITHNIVATCDADNSITPSIGKRSYSNSYFAQMSLYDFMLFDEISTDDKIKELNTYIGITPKVTLPNYYWDNYGKKEY